MRESILPVVVCVLLSTGCGGPERAPSQPIAGVDRAHPEDANPYDVEGGTVAEPFPGSFVQEVAAAVKVEPGVVAVFPALTHSFDQNINVVNGLGEHMASETAARLVDAGVQVLSRSDLVNAMRSSSLPLASYGSEADALQIGSKVGAAYVVSGRVDKKVFNLNKRDEVLEIDWHCRSVKDGQVVARYRKALTGGPLANDLFRYYGLKSEWEDSIRMERTAPAGSPP